MKKVRAAVHVYFRFHEAVRHLKFAQVKEIVRGQENKSRQSLLSPERLFQTVHVNQVFRDSFSF